MVSVESCRGFSTSFPFISGLSYGYLQDLHPHHCPKIPMVPISLSIDGLSRSSRILRVSRSSEILA